MRPGLQRGVVAVCDDGGLYAVANIRGGAEEGEAWHRAGMREHKQQVLRRLPRRRRLAGRPQGIDVARPAGHPGRQQRRPADGRGHHPAPRPLPRRAVRGAAARHGALPPFLIARLWIPEYGDPDSPTSSRGCYAYSPYHHVVDGTCYPAVLLTTAEEDDSRVDPMHARKMAARLQEATSCGDDHPVLLREEAQAGHGQGKPVSRQADELADVLAFLWWQLQDE